MNSNAEMLADRYGRSRRGGSSRGNSLAGPNSGRQTLRTRLALWAFGAVALGLFVAWAIFSISGSAKTVSLVSSATKPLTATSFEVSGKVERPTGGVVRCALQVQALNFAVVGYREIELPPGTSNFKSTVFSFAPGVNASVQSCWLQ